MDLQVLGDTSINTHGLPLHQVRLTVLGGDTFLVTRCCKAGVPATTNISIFRSNLNCLRLHVRHHLDLQILDQLHFSLVKLWHCHLHDFVGTSFNEKFLFGDFFFNFRNNFLLFDHLRLPLL